ncbi:MAG TPA: HNH endonuclease signature motif containing protein [Verrucomicrobiae bacterium]|nr:HNH endonuclease signature motif containing protein [Verrucomicrobiae bacterium]
MPHHSKASNGSQKCCDNLLNSLRILIPDVARFQSQETCALYVPGKNRFAHIYHRGKAAVIRVYFRGDIPQPISDLDGSIVVHRREKTEKGWDKEFPFFASISTDKSISALAKLIAVVAYPLSEKKRKGSSAGELADSTLVADIKTIISDKTADPTTVQALVYARVGQGKFGLAVRELWNNRCSVTGSSTKVALEASHIKSWADSSDAQRLDPNNGLLLTANLHKLFDARLISFDDSGKMLVSSKLSQSEQEILGVIGKKLSKKPSIETANYLSHHRTKFLK